MFYSRTKRALLAYLCNFLGSCGPSAEEIEVDLSDNAPSTQDSASVIFNPRWIAPRAMRAAQLDTAVRQLQTSKCRLAARLQAGCLSGRLKREFWRSMSRKNAVEGLALFNQVRRGTSCQLHLLEVRPG